jgi:hypothetical protein
MPGSQNTFNVGSKAPGTGGIVDNIQGGLVIAASELDTLNVDDTGSTTAKAGTLTDSTSTGLGLGPDGITYSGLHALHINLGSVVNHFLVDVSNATDLPPDTTVDGGSSQGSAMTATWTGDANERRLLFSSTTARPAYWIATPSTLSMKPTWSRPALRGAR